MIVIFSFLLLIINADALVFSERSSHLLTSFLSFLLCGLLFMSALIPNPKSKKIQIEIGK